MKSNKTYRFETNPQEKVLHDQFIKEFDGERGSFLLSAIIFGWVDGRQSYPKEFLTEKEEDICLNLIQWLGSPVGQGFLDQCGYELKNN